MLHKPRSSRLIDSSWTIIWHFFFWIPVIITTGIKCKLFDALLEGIFKILINECFFEYFFIYLALEWNLFSLLCFGNSKNSMFGIVEIEQLDYVVLKYEFSLVVCKVIDFYHFNGSGGKLFFKAVATRKTHIRLLSLRLLQHFKLTFPRSKIIHKLTYIRPKRNLN